MNSTNNKKWEDLQLPLSSPVLKTLKALKFTSTTPIQVTNPYTFLHPVLFL